MDYSDNRRDFLKTLGVGAVASTLAFKAPYVFAKNTSTIRVMGTHVTLQEELRQKAMLELGINIEFTPMGSAAVLQKAASDPSSFDLYEQWSDSINILWQAGAIQPIETERLTYWDEINPLSKTGKIVPEAKLGAGDSPNKLLYVQADGTLATTPSDAISFLPYVHNVDSFGYNTQFIEKGIPYETESWSWLLDEKNKGKVALVNAPTIGIFYAALAAEAQGHVKDAAYEYMNWWLSGYPGAFIARQGYYISNPERSQPLMSKAEWQYWYEGQEASMDLRGTDGKISVQAGQARDGGSYIKRFSNIAVWNTVMPNYDYSLDKWYELLNS